MSLEGRLEDLSLPDIFQIISLSKRSGVLTIIRKEGTARLVFSQGRVIFASSDARNRLGYVLVKKGIITNEELETSLKKQKTNSGKVPLGAILIEMGALTMAQLEKELKIHISRVVGDLLTWDTGSFHFELGDVIEWDGDIPLKTGISTEFLLLESARIYDEEKEEQKKEEKERIIPDEKPGKLPETEIRKDLSLLLSMIAEIAGPSSSSSSEITLLILRFASEIMNRSVVFLVREEDIIGLGQCGVNLVGAVPDERIRNIKIPLTDQSVFKDAVQKMINYKGKLTDSKWNRYFVEELGGDWPEEVFVSPVITENKAIAILYGDNIPNNIAIPDVDGLEAFIKIAGFIFEKNLLQRKIQDLIGKSIQA